MLTSTFRKVGPDKSYSPPKCPSCMNNTNPLSSLYTQEIALLELQDFMFDTMLPAGDCVDWFCDRFDVSATDDVIDFVVDAHFAFHGE